VSGILEAARTAQGVIIHPAERVMFTRAWLRR